MGDACKPSCSDGKGGYDAAAPGAGEGQMYYYEGSILHVEWTMDQGCGHANRNQHCTMVLQYMCDDLAPGLRDGSTTERIPETPAEAAGPQYGMHEPLEWYTDCKKRSRNKGLYIADQELAGAHVAPRPTRCSGQRHASRMTSALMLAGESAIHTRQNPNGSRSGFECPEERDYYP